MRDTDVASCEVVVTLAVGTTTVVDNKVLKTTTGAQLPALLSRTLLQLCLKQWWKHCAWS